MAEFGKDWIIENSRRILETYSGQAITVRQLYYRLVSIGLPNTIQSYKRVVSSTTDARWNGDIEFDAFIDRERGLVGETEAAIKDLDDEITDAQDVIKYCMASYKLNAWSNQKDYVEVWVEKKALQGVFEEVCNDEVVALAPCKGYPSLTFLSEARDRLEKYDGDKEITIIYFGDYDPSGEDIPRSIKENLSRLGIDVHVQRIGLTPAQINQYNLPGVPAKSTDSRTAAWGGHEAVELDAMEPKNLVALCRAAIRSHFDDDLYDDLKKLEAKEKKLYVKRLKDFVQGLGDDITKADDDQGDDQDDDDQEAI